MPDLKNQSTEQKTKFVQREDWVAFSGVYTDPIGNRWRLDVAGHEEVVGPFVEQKPFSLAVRPFRQEWITPSDLGAQEPLDSDLDSSDELPPEPPGLEVTFTLEDLAAGLQLPYMVAFEIDPCMVDNYDSYNFCLKGSDTTANVGYTSNGGEIRVSLLAGGRFRTSAGTEGAVNIANVPKHTWCFVGVRRKSGNPCYTLSGDITVT